MQYDTLAINLTCNKIRRVFCMTWYAKIVLCRYYIWNHILFFYKSKIETQIYDISSIPNSERISYPNPKKILKDIKALHVPNSAFSLVHRMFYFCTLFSFYELLHICNTCCTAVRYLGMCNNSSARPKLMYLNSFMCWYKTTFSDKNIYFVNRKLKHSPIKEEFSHMVLAS